MGVNKIESSYKQELELRNEFFFMIKFLLIVAVYIFPLDDVSRETSINIGG